jgi:hypothetical protein
VVSLATLMGAGIAAILWQLASHAEWPLTTTFKHILAFPNCAAAKAVGLAPANEGEPGYWPRHDADGDGKSCDPFP